MGPARNFPKRRSEKIPSNLRSSPPPRSACRLIRWCCCCCSSGTRSCISRSSVAQLGSACAPTAHSHTRLLRWCCCCCRVTISSGTAETAVCMPLDQMVLLLLPSQSVLALPRPQLVNGRAVTISSGTAETAVCMPLSAAAHSEPHSQQLVAALSQLVARLVSTRERAQALAAASAARQRHSSGPHAPQRRTRIAINQSTHSRTSSSSAAALRAAHSQLVARLVSTRERAQALAAAWAARRRHSEPHSQLVARLVSTRERAQALAAAS